MATIRATTGAAGGLAILLSQGTAVAEGGDRRHGPGEYADITVIRLGRGPPQPIPSRWLGRRCSGRRHSSCGVSTTGVRLQNQGHLGERINTMTDIVAAARGRPFGVGRGEDVDMDGIAAQQARLRTLSHNRLTPTDAEWLVAQARPALWMVPTTTASGRSRFGGDPVLAPGTPWPTERSVPLTLLTVIDLTEVHRTVDHQPGPRAGLLNVFYDLDRELGGDPYGPGTFRLVWTSDSDAEHPEPQSSILDDMPVFGETAVTLKPLLTLPDPYECMDSFSNDDGFDKYIDLYTDWDEIARDRGYINQYGGWAQVHDEEPWCRALSACGQDASDGYEGLPAGWHPLLRLDFSYRDVDGHSYHWNWPGGRDSFNLIAGPRFTDHADDNNCLLILD